jgi:hypothetical protein
MAVTHSTAARDAAANAVVDLLDVSGPGDLRFLTSGDAEVATLTLSNPAFGASSSGTATASAITSDTNATGGTVAKFDLRNGTGTSHILGSVTATSGGGDIELSSLSVGSGDTVSVTSLTYSAAP